MNRGVGAVSGPRDARRIVPEALAVLWIIAVAVAAFIPALIHGISLGPYTYLTSYGLRYGGDAGLHNALLSDQITQMIPWSNLAWTQVHHGQLPLWNPFSVLGTPLAFNWQSAAFSLPAAIGYLFPLRMAYSIQVMVTVVVAGTGIYVLGRVLRVGIIGSTFAGIAFELCGPFFSWVGWPIASVFSWSGWLFAATILVVRGGRRFVSIVCLALAIGLAVYAGQPDTLVLLFGFTVLFAIVLLFLRWHPLGGPGLTWRPVLDLVIGGVAGLALSAPLLLPGAQLLGGAVRNRSGGTLGGNLALPVKDIVNLFVAFTGDPTVPASTIGTVVIVFAVVTMVVRRRQPEVIALVVVGAAAALLTTSPPVIAMMSSLPGLHSVRWPRAITPLAMAVTVLAGMGLDLVVRARLTAKMIAVIAGAFAALGLTTLVLYLIGPGVPVLPYALQSPLPAHFRTRSFLWDGIEAAVAISVMIWLFVALRQPSQHGRRGEIARANKAATRSVPLLVGGAAAIDQPEHVGPSESIDPKPAEPSMLSDRRRKMEGGATRSFRDGTGHSRLVAGRIAALVLLVCQSIFLIAGVEFVWSSAASPLGPTQVEVQLQRLVGTATVGLGSGNCLAPPGVGILPNANIVFGIHQMAVYDPMLPRTYFSSWKQTTGGSGGLAQISTFCPSIPSVNVARQYGIGYVLTTARGTPPTGATFVTTLGKGQAAEDLYRIRGAAPALLVPDPGSHVVPGPNAAGTPVMVTHSNPGTWRMASAGNQLQMLRLHLTNSPGWTATIDGRPLPLMPFSQVMLQARIPPGRHTIVLRYWPRTFTAGLILALCAAACLAISGVIGYRSVHQGSRKSSGEPPQVAQG